jgi:hypothetical protein
LFAGRYNDKTLYAVGIITASDGTGGPTDIAPTTTKVTFTLSPLLNDINAKSEAGPGQSTFLITGPTASVPDSHNYSSVGLTSIPMVKLTGGKEYPIFALPKHGYANTGSPAPSTTTDIMASYTVNCGASSNTNFAGVMVATGAKIVSAGYSDDESKDLGVEVGGSVTAPVAGSVIPATGLITLLIDVENAGHNGLSRLSIEVPVCPISNVNSFPGTWYIRGGMNQIILDEGIKAAAPIGGAVLLAVGPVSINGVDINKTW